MKQQNSAVTWNDMVAWLDKNKNIILFGGAFGLALVLTVTTLSIWFFNMVIQPLTLSMSLTVYYAILSSFDGHRRELLVKEAMCYYVATVVIFVLGIGFVIPQA